MIAERISVTHKGTETMYLICYIYTSLLENYWLVLSVVSIMPKLGLWGLSDPLGSFKLERFGNS